MGLKCKFMPSKEFLEDEYLVKLKTYKDIGKENGVDAAAVCYWIKKYSIPARHRNKVMHPRVFTSAERQATSNRFKGRVVSDETRKKMAESKRLKGMGAKKKRADGYITIYYPTYPSSNSEGFVMEHRYLMERHIGRPLDKNEVVHHINHDRTDNRLENLMLLTASEHAKLHAKERYKK